MLIDKTTLQDLAVFHPDEEQSLFAQIDHTSTAAGRQVLQKIFSNPLQDIAAIREVQEILNLLVLELGQWPGEITNGTMLVVEKFLDDNPNSIPEQPDLIKSFLYRLLNAGDYAMILFSMRQLFALIGGFEKMHLLLRKHQLPKRLEKLISESEQLISHPQLAGFTAYQSFQEMTTPAILHYARVFHIELPVTVRRLLEIHADIDAWKSMAIANKKLSLHLPVFEDSNTPLFEIRDLKHILLKDAVGYDLLMDKNQHFIFLTGANMAGKSTLIKAVGLSVYLAHLGMGVPASFMRLSLFEGLLSNINVTDNIIKGESYFYNEVRRIKETLLKISDKRKWLVLIDELFKGTNMQDAMKCTVSVVEGLSKAENALFILSSHLYEIGDDLKRLPTLRFKYFETILKNNDLHFSYQLKDGISKDRMGYLILQKEGVTTLLENIGKNQVTAED
jgi:DNA mismatch repair ATPase MutS